MDGILVVLIVASAAAYAVSRVWRAVATARRKDGGCGGGCCSPE